MGSLSHSSSSRATKPSAIDRVFTWLIVVLAVLALSDVTLHAQDAAGFFKQNCTSCHTIGGGRLTGPDLKDVTTRRDRQWFVQFRRAPKR